MVSNQTRIDYFATSSEKIDLKGNGKDYDNLVYHPKTVKHKRSIAFLLKAFQPACIKHLSRQVRTLAYIYSFSRSQTFYQLEIIESCLFLIIMALGRVCAQCVRVYILHTLLKIQWVAKWCMSTAHDQWVIFITIKFIINGVLYVKYCTFHCLKMLI